MFYFSQESPYIFTNLNSFPVGSGEYPTFDPVTTRTSEPQTSRPVSSATAHTSDMVKTTAEMTETSAAVVVTTPAPPEEPECDVCLDPEVDDWVIAVICVLSAAVLLQTLLLFVLLKKPKQHGYNLKM